MTWRESIMAKKKKPVMTDINIHYLVPMCKLSNPCSSERREVKIISSNEGMIRCQVVEDADLFEIHSFWDEYFQWLIYTGYIIPLVDDFKLPDHINITRDIIKDSDKLSADNCDEAVKSYLLDCYGCCPESFCSNIMSTIIAVWNIKWPTNC